MTDTLPRRVTRAANAVQPDPPAPEWQVFHRLDLILAAGLDDARRRYGDDADAFRGLYVTADQAAQLLAHPFGSRSPVRVTDPDWDVVAEQHPGWSWLRSAYALTDLELDMVLLALAPEADLRYERLYGVLQDDVGRRRPTAGLALDLLTSTTDERRAARAALRPDAALLAERVLSLVPDPREVEPPLLAHILKLDEQITDVLLRQGGLDRRLTAWCTLDARPGPGIDELPLPERQAGALFTAARAAWRHGALRLYFSGPPGSGRRSTARALAASLSAPLLTVDLTRLPADAQEARNVLPLVFREARLHGALLYLDGLDRLREERAGSCLPVLTDQLAGHDGVTILAAEQDWQPLGGSLGVLPVSFARPGLSVRRRIWGARLAAHGVATPPEDVAALAARYRLQPGQVDDAIATARASARWRAGAEGTDPAAMPTTAEIFAAARAQTGHHLAALARRREPTHDWDDLVLPDDSVAQLHELCQRVGLRDQVLHGWGFARMAGPGITALFSGPPGTGKTMAADIIAADIGVALFTIDLSAVVSKYIGETEKNLQRLFAAARDSDAILLFDEADALFGRRSAVHDAHDRYANLETSYLLQRMEEHEGLAILTTNLREHLDEAFTRRFQFIIDFPFPGEVERRRVWEVCLAAAAPRSGLDLDLLSRHFRLSGASIRNAVVHAAFLAAADGASIGMDHLVRGVRREHQKMGKPMPDADPGREVDERGPS